MPDRTPCPHCGKVGFVRREHVIKGGRTVTAFYCGACNRSWEVGAGDETPKRSADKDK